MIDETLTQRITEAGVPETAVATKLSVATIYRAMNGDVKPATMRYISLVLEAPAGVELDVTEVVTR